MGFALGVFFAPLTPNDVCLFIYLLNRWLNKLGLASIQYQPTEQTTAVGKHPRQSDAPHQVWPVNSFSKVYVEPWLCVCMFDFLYVHRAECYSEASDQEEAESTEIPPPPYSEQTLRNSAGVSGPPGSTHQVSHVCGLASCTEGCLSLTIVFIYLNFFSNVINEPYYLSGYPSSPLLFHSPQWSKRFTVLPRQYNDITELYLLACEAPAVLVGPSLAGISFSRGNGRRGVLSSGTLTSAP